jgi:hypothetical protein
MSLANEWVDGAVVARQTATSTQRISSTPAHDECGRRDAEVVMEIRIQQIW